MKKMLSRYSRDLLIATIGSTISSISFIAVIFDSDNIIIKLIKILFAILFWAGLILEQIFIWNANKNRKKISNTIAGRKISYPLGVYTFFKTEFGFFTDIVLIFSLIIYLFLEMSNLGPNVIRYIFLFLIVFSFRLHCIANGKNYRYKLYLQKRRANDENN